MRHHPYLYLPRRTTDPELHYRRALAEYLVVEQDLLRAREGATLRARVQALQRQEEARLLQARIVRARKERELQQLKPALAQRRAAAIVSKTEIPEDHLSLHHTVPVTRSVRERRRTPSFSVTQTPQTHVLLTDKSRMLDSMPDPANEVCRMYILSTDSSDTPNQGQSEHRTAPHQNSAPTLESLLQERLRKVVTDEGDEEVQNIARVILHYLVPDTSEGHATETSALSSEVSCHCGIPSNSLPPTTFSQTQTKLDSDTQPAEGADLSRSDALQGAAAEAAKASFKAHRTAIAEQSAPSPLQTIQDIRSILSKLSADFSLPISLDFSDDEEDGLAYTPTNAPIRVYEHALEGLLAQLDAVESDGDEEVRLARRAVVKEVEMALEGVEKRVKAAREAAKDSSSKSNEDVLVKAAASSPVLESKDVHIPVESMAEVKTEELERPASISSFTTAASNSSLTPVSTSDVGLVSCAADSADIAPNKTAVEDAFPVFAQESTAVTALSPSARPAAVQDEVGNAPEWRHDGAVAEQLAPTPEPSVSTVSEIHEEADSVSPEGFASTIPISLSVTLLEDVSTSRISVDGEASGPEGADDEDGWYEVEA